MGKTMHINKEIENEIGKTDLQHSSALERLHHLGNGVVLVGTHPKLTLTPPTPHEEPTQLTARLWQAGILVNEAGLGCHMLHAY